MKLQRRLVEITKHQFKNKSSLKGRKILKSIKNGDRKGLLEL